MRTQRRAAAAMHEFTIVTTYEATNFLAFSYLVAPLPSHVFSRLSLLMGPVARKRHFDRTTAPPRSSNDVQGQQIRTHHQPRTIIRRESQMQPWRLSAVLLTWRWF